jgi:fluoroacetyl-CoA thioesterase
MPLEDLKPGLRHSQSIMVDERLTVAAVSQAFTGFADMPPVFATAFLVGFVEWTCIEALRPFLAPQQRTVGVHVDLSHSAATPVGGTVTAEVELVSVEGPRLRFKILCRDDADVVSEGFHERYVVDATRFMRRLEGKRGRILEAPKDGA